LQEKRHHQASGTDSETAALSWIRQGAGHLQFELSAKKEKRWIKSVITKHQTHPVVPN